MSERHRYMWVVESVSIRRGLRHYPIMAKNSRRDAEEYVKFVNLSPGTWRIVRYTPV